MTHRPGYGHKARMRIEKPEGWHSEFENLELPHSLIDAIRDADFTEMTPIQREALPISLKGLDVIGQAQTGTGKTAVFLLALFKQLLEDSSERPKAPRALILSPTRELAIQTSKEAHLLGKYTGLRLGLFYGGKDYLKQQRALEAGVDVAVGTPGRVLDFIRHGLLKTSFIRFLVIDEADRLLDLGFFEELTAILRTLPAKEKRQSMMFSATFDARTRQIAGRYMRNPSFIEIQPEHITAEGIEEKLFHVEAERKFELLLGILRREDVPKGLIFANMKITAAFIAEKLRRNGFAVGILTGDLPQNARTRILDEFRSGTIPLLVASDVASRGLDIENVTHIINYDVPQDPEDYVHRIGRTARAGRTGVAYTLACDEYVFNLPAIESYLKRSIPFTYPEDEDFGEDKAAGLDRAAFKRMQRSKKSSDRSWNKGPNRPFRGRRR